MKKYHIATLVSILCLATAAQSSIQLYNKDGHKVTFKGRVKAMNLLGDRENAIDGEGDKTKARLGFDGQTQITDSLSGYGRAEWEFKTSSSTTVDNRDVFAGLRLANFGSIDYGRNSGIVKNVTAYTDVLPEFGGDAGNNKTYLLSKRSNSVLTYRNDNDFVDGLRFGLQYAAHPTDTNFGKKNSVDAYGLSASYEIANSGISVAGAYAQTGQDEEFKTWATGLKYDANDLYLAAMYIASKQNLDNSDKKYQGYEFVAQYGFDLKVGRITPSIAYISHENRSDKIQHKSLVDYVDVGAIYDFNKNMKAIVDYKINLLDKDDVGAKKLQANTKNVLGVGLMYQF